MRVIPILPAPGKSGWAVASPARPLPKGLANRTRVKVVYEQSPTRFLVKDLEGTRWLLQISRLDLGCRYLPDGETEWLSESDARVQEYLLGEIARCEAEPRSAAVKAEIDLLKWKMTRTRAEA